MVPVMKIEGFRDLVAWQKAMDLTVTCYQLSRAFPTDERFGLTSQLRRAAVSVAANIAEGKGRGFNKAFVNYLSIAGGSLCEVSTHLEIALRLDYLKPADFHRASEQIEEVGRLVTALRKSVETALAPSGPPTTNQ
jgi:four helix bundle protein